MSGAGINSSSNHTTNKGEKMSTQRVTAAEVRREAQRLAEACRAAGVIGSADDLHVSAGSRTNGVAWTVLAYGIDGRSCPAGHAFPGLYGGKIGRTAAESLHTLEVLRIGVESTIKGWSVRNSDRVESAGGAA